MLQYMAVGSVAAAIPLSLVVLGLNPYNRGAVRGAGPGVDLGGGGLRGSLRAPPAVAS
jgi:hypothetical protein